MNLGENAPAPKERLEPVGVGWEPSARRGYCVSTAGLDEQKIRQYIREQEEEEKRQELLPLGGLQSPSRGKPGA